ncbi:hypothetical protein EZS27_031466, partial [termite gut metagenome]
FLLFPYHVALQMCVFIEFASLWNHKYIIIILQKQNLAN